MKLKGCLIIVGVFLIACVIFASLFTSTYVIKSYKYSWTRDELLREIIQVVNANRKLTFNPIDTTGTDPNDLNYYADIVVKTEKRNYKFTIKYFTNSSILDRGIYSEISLATAFDLHDNIVVYSPRDPDADRLVEIFEKYFINKLDKNTSL